MSAGARGTVTVIVTAGVMMAEDLAGVGSIVVSVSETGRGMSAGEEEEGGI